MNFTATIPAALPWDSQVIQYPLKGEPGIGYFAGETELGTVDCLLFRDVHGDVVGILNHYGMDMPPWEVAGNVNVFVHPDRKRRGIGTRLVKEAMYRWDFTLDSQRFTEEGAALAASLRNDGIM